MYQIFECSPKAALRIRSREDRTGFTTLEAYTPGPNTKYPWPLMQIGQCFTVSMDQVRDSTLRSLACTMSKKLKKKFIFICHNELRLYEIARIA